MIYLYLKTHNVTGLKYLGKTIRKDPHKYKGSGKLWKKHIQEHGYDVTTVILFQSESSEEIKEQGLYLSATWDVVNSDEWANLIPEGGHTNAFWTGKKRPRESVEKQIATIKVNGYNCDHDAALKAWTGSKHKPETIELLREQRKQYMSSLSQDEMKLRIDAMREASLGSKWWNNGTIELKKKEKPGEDFSLGRLKRKLLV